MVKREGSGDACYIFTSLFPAPGLLQGMNLTRSRCMKPVIADYACMQGADAGASAALGCSEIQLTNHGKLLPSIPFVSHLLGL